MAFHLHAMLAALFLAFAASQAASPGEDYWNSMLPNTPMPRAISNVLLAGNEEEIVPDLRRNGYKRKHYTLGTETDKDEVVMPDLRRNGYKRKHYTLGTDNVGTENEKDEAVIPDLRRSGYKRKHYTLGTTENAETEKDGVVVQDLNRSGYQRTHYTLSTTENAEKDEVVVVPDFRRSGYKRKHFTSETSPEDDEVAIPDLRRRDYKRKHNTLGTENEKDEVVIPDLRRSGYKRKHYTSGISPEEDEVAIPDLRRSGYKRKHYTTLSSDKDEVVLPDLRRSGYKRKHYSPKSGKDEVLVNPPSAPWFLEKDLYTGNQMEMAIPRPENGGTTFVPRRVADSIPFSSEKFTTILIKLSVKPNSGTAQLIKDTIKECELPAEEGETKTCATSLESMIDFSISKLGKNIKALSTEAEKDTKLQNFTIVEGIKKIADKEAVVCHKENYPYAVFYCHDVKGAMAYVVPFVGASSGTKVAAVGVCHTDTSGWNPEHEAFKILKVKPGAEPVCHFLPEYNVLWTRK